MKKRIDELTIGDMVDLEGDKYCRGAQDIAPFTAFTVCEIERETPDCIAIGFDGYDVVGFPPDHVLEVLDHAAEYADDYPPASIRKAL